MQGNVSRLIDREEFVPGGGVDIHHGTFLVLTGQCASGVPSLYMTLDQYSRIFIAMSNKFIHCDCDCFFAAIEIRDDPALAGLPVAVGGSEDRRGVIATCNYEARKYGIHSAMASATAKRLCRELIIIPNNMEKYRIASQQMNWPGRIFAE